MSMTIGPIVLEGFEMPQTVRYGGSQRLITHRLADGRRIIETLGAEELDISFDGTLSGIGAIEKARALDRLRQSGRTVLLKWSSFICTIIVRHFHAEFRSDTWIPYQM